MKAVAPRLRSHTASVLLAPTSYCPRWVLVAVRRLFKKRQGRLGYFTTVALLYLNPGLMGRYLLLGVTIIVAQCLKVCSRDDGLGGRGIAVSLALVS